MLSREEFNFIGMPAGGSAVTQPIMIQQFQSTSGRTIIQYYSYNSGICGIGSNCNFRGPIHVPNGFEQVEVFLSGFTLMAQSQVGEVKGVSAQVQKFRYETTTGKLEVGVNGQFSTDSGQPYSYQVTFVVVLTDSAAAKFTHVGNGCAGIANCNVTRFLPGAVPSNLHYIGLGTRLFDLGSRSGPLLVNTLSAHIKSLSVNPPDVLLDYLCSLQDASGTNKMFCEWDASIIAFDPTEMERNNSTIFPQYTFFGRNISARQSFTNGDQAPSGAAITGFLNAFEGLTLFYDVGQEHAIWMIESSASNFQMAGVPPNTALTEYGIFLGTIFGDTTNAAQYVYQESRALGLLL